MNEQEAVASAKEAARIAQFERERTRRERQREMETSESPPMVAAWLKIREITSNPSSWSKPKSGQ